MDQALGNHLNTLNGGNPLPDTRRGVEPVAMELDDDLQQARDRFFGILARSGFTEIQRIEHEQRIILQVVTQQRLRNAARQLPSSA